MKKVYKQPTIKVVKLNPCTAMLTITSYGNGIEGTGIDNTLGGNEDFG